MQFGPFRFEIEKSYDDLVQIINRTKGSSVENLKGNSHAQLREYKSWVFSCVSLISERISTVEYGFYNSITGDELFTNNKGYKVFSKPFKNPNPLMSFRFIKAFCTMQMDLCGMAVIYKAKNKLGQIWELWPLNMDDFVHIDISDDFLNPTIKYTFRFDDKLIEFDDSELCVFKYPNPTSLYEPMSPIQAQAYAIDIDTYVEVYERDFFKNSARIDMALYTDSELDSDKAQEIKNRWKSKYSGNFHDIAVLDSGLKPVPLKFTNKDFEFMNLANWSYDKILSTYKVPKSKLGGGGANRASSVIDDISFNRECIQPRLTLIDEELTKEVLKSFDERLEFRHYNPVPRDRDLEVKEARVYLSGLPAMTINEYRKETKIGGPVPGGDRLLIPQGWIPLEKLDEVMENQNNDSTDSGDQPSATDPARHDNDEPHVNPDGTDDRDDLPTDGRSFNNDGFLHKFFEIEDDLRPIWTQIIFENIKSRTKEGFISDIKDLICDLIKNTQDSIYTKYDDNFSCDNDYTEWISNISDKTSNEFYNTVYKFNNENALKDIESNPRIIKITNSLLKASINYAKYVYMSENNIEFDWKVNRNECVHKSRIKWLGSTFEVGGTKFNFPNQILNFSCDCTIVPKEEN